MMTLSIIYGGYDGETHSIDYDGPPTWEGIWEKFLTELTIMVPNMPLVKIGGAESLKQIGLSEDGVHICVPIFYSDGDEPLIIMQIPIPDVIDLVFFRKFAEFIANVLNSTTSKCYHIRWSGLYENIICMNREHIQHVTGFSDVIMERVVNSIHVVLGDWHGYTSLTLGDDSNASLHYTGRFFMDEHLTRTRTQQDLLANKTRNFSTIYSMGQHHGYFWEIEIKDEGESKPFDAE